MREVKKDTIGYITSIWVPDSASTVGGGRTGLTATDVALSYMRVGASLPIICPVTSVSLLGTFIGNASLAGWREINASLMSAWYEVHLPNAAFASHASVDQVRFHLRDSSTTHTMTAVPFNIWLTGDKPNDVLSTLYGLNLHNIGGVSAASLPPLGTWLQLMMCKNSSQTFTPTTDSLEAANDLSFSRLQITKGVAGTFPFFIEATTGTGAAGLTGIQGYYSRDATTFTTFAGAISEVARGWYKQPYTASESWCDSYIFEFEKAGYRIARVFGWTQQIG